MARDPTQPEAWLGLGLGLTLTLTLTLTKARDPTQPEATVLADTPRRLRRLRPLHASAARLLPLPPRKHTRARGQRVRRPVVRGGLHRSPCRGRRGNREVIFLNSLESL